MPDDLTPYESEVLAQCQALQASGEPAFLAALARVMNTKPTNERLANARLKVIRLGLFVVHRKYKSRPLKPTVGYSYINRSETRCRPKSEPMRTVSRDERPDRHGFSDEVRAYEAAWKRLRTGVKMPEPIQEQTT